MRPRVPGLLVPLASCILLLLPLAVLARPPIRADFFATYPNAVGTQLDVLPSNSRHCGVCHFDFNGGGPRNPYGLAIEVGRNNGLTNVQAILAVQNNDSDADGQTNLVEITDVTHFSNTPTFPGLSTANMSSTVNIPAAEITPYLVPSGGTDTTPPSVMLSSPNGGESVVANTTYTVSYSASDASGIAEVSIFLSDDGGATYQPMALHLAPGGSFGWFVPNLPGSGNLLQVVARDNAGNYGQDQSNAAFTISAPAGGRVPTTLRDMKLPGSQPLSGVVLDDPTTTCVTCHGNYDPANEPWATWRGSMMAQAMRDPFFKACMTVSEQDAPSVGDLCLRCHTPGGWLEGRSVDTKGGLITAKDREGIQCDFCHRLVDRNYVAGSSPPQDTNVLAAINPLPLQYGNGQYLADANPLRRGPYTDAQANHDFVYSPLHRAANLCGTCHDVSNPVFVRAGPGDYTPNAFNQEHPTEDVRNMFPVERTFSEWSQSAYANGGVYAPQFAGNKPDGIVSTCQDCHMRAVNAKGCNQAGVTKRTDLPLHDLMGGNTFIPDLLPAMYPSEVTTTELQAAKQRAIAMLQLAATLQVTPQSYGVRVRVTNETAHKLPSGYPEGRRIWINVRAKDTGGQTVFQSGVYDPATGVLAQDAQLKVYEIHPGLSPSLAAALGLPAGPSFHFVLNDTVYLDNRVPPRGFSNAAFAAVQSPPVGHDYADGQNWDETPYFIPMSAESVIVSLYYQSTSKEYIEFLRDANTTNSAGQDLYNAWVANGRSAPVLMTQTAIAVRVVSGTADGNPAAPPFGLAPAEPNPFSSRTRITYNVPATGTVKVGLYDVTGRAVRVLVDRRQNPGRYDVTWDGRDDRGLVLPAGIYFARFQLGAQHETRRIVRTP
jgi:flagellar hook capping protein FlgD/Big-like domain-containing protein/cytochrome c554/c'-like protein